MSVTESTDIEASIVPDAHLKYKRNAELTREIADAAGIDGYAAVPSNGHGHTAFTRAERHELLAHSIAHTGTEPDVDTADYDSEQLNRVIGSVLGFEARGNPRFNRDELKIIHTVLVGTPSGGGSECQ